MKRILLLAGAGLFASTAFAADISGKWTGRMSLDSTAIKRELQKESVHANPAQKKDIEDRIRKIDASVQMVAKNVVKMDLKKGGVVILDLMRNGKSDPERGRWSRKGSKLFLLNLTGGGDKRFEMKGVILNGDKTLFFDMSEMMVQEMKAKGLRSTVRPKLTLSFKKS